MMGILPSFLLESVIISIDISLLLAFPMVGYCVGALPIALSVKNREKDCPHCKNNGSKRVSFAVDHIRTRGIDGIHAWGSRARFLHAFYWFEMGLFIGLVITFVF